MQINALRSANFAKLSSNSSTSDEYWVTSISAGTPAGYCLSQIRSMVFPLWLFPCFLAGRLVLGSIVKAAADGKRLRAIDAFRQSGIIQPNGSKRADYGASRPVNQPACFRPWV